MRIYRSNERGYSKNSWLESHFSFSFAEYFNPFCMQFGALRVINDDVIQGGRGFGMHPHKDMEIITIPLDGKLQHQDSLGNTGVIENGMTQIMSAGTGILHSEFNPEIARESRLLQIWIFPNKQRIQPRYIDFTYTTNNNDFLVPVAVPSEEILSQQILGEFHKNQIQKLKKLDGELPWIQQSAWIFRGKIRAGETMNYTASQRENGIYIFVIDGKLQTKSDEMEQGVILNTRDAGGFWQNHNTLSTKGDNSLTVTIAGAPDVSETNFIIIDVPYDAYV